MLAFCWAHWCAVDQCFFPLETRGQRLSDQERALVGTFSSAVFPGKGLERCYQLLVIDTLVLSTVAADDGIRNDPVYWAWLTYAFWSKASQSSVQTLEISQINLTEEHVNTIKHVLTIIYPGPKAATGSARSRFGYVDMKKGTRVRPTGERNRVLELSQDRCCRAFYDESSLDNVANAVIPGFEICKVKLLNGMTKFVGDTLTSRKFGPTMSASGIRSQFDTHRR